MHGRHRVDQPEPAASRTAAKQEKDAQTPAAKDTAPLVATNRPEHSNSYRAGSKLTMEPPKASTENRAVRPWSRRRESPSAVDGSASADSTFDRPAWNSRVKGRRRRREQERGAAETRPIIPPRAAVVVAAAEGGPVAPGGQRSVMAGLRNL